MKTVDTYVVLGFCYFFAILALVTGTLALTTGLELVPDVQLIEASADNEFRFFSAFWLGYGGLCFWVTRDVSARQNFVPALALVMFVGGVGRALSFALVGEPTSTYVIGGVVEMLIPPVWYYAYRRNAAAQDPR